jgi:hypothetical protein
VEDRNSNVATAQRLRDGRPVAQAARYAAPQDTGGVAP